MKRTKEGIRKGRALKKRALKKEGTEKGGH